MWPRLFATAALTFYEMVKAVDWEAVITDICVIENTGGKSGHWVREEVSQ